MTAAHGKLVQASKVILMLIGMIVASFGLFGFAAELWHVFEGDHEIRWTIIGIAAAMVLGGAGLVQTMNVVDAFSLVREFVPLLRSQQIGGRRATDPKTAEHTVVTQMTVETPTDEPDV